MSAITRRSFLHSTIAAAALGVPTALAAQPIQPDQKHTFWRHDGGGVYSNTINDGLLTLSASADGSFLFNFGFTPTDDEIQRLIRSDPASGYEMSHVLLTVKYFGITPMYSYVPEIEYTFPNVSEYARVGGAFVSQEASSIDYTVVSLNFGTWEAGRRLRVHGSIDDCTLSGPEAASVEVWLQPCRTWIEGVDEDHPDLILSRSQDGEWKHYATLPYGEPSQLYAGQNSRFYF
jgi:hypothetical protein